MHCLYSLTARECLRISGDNLGNFDGKKSFLLSKIFLGTVLSPEILRDVRRGREEGKGRGGREEGKGADGGGGGLGSQTEYLDIYTNCSAYRASVYADRTAL